MKQVQSIEKKYYSKDRWAKTIKERNLGENDQEEDQDDKKKPVDAKLTQGSTTLDDLLDFGNSA